MLKELTTRQGTFVGTTTIDHVVGTGVTIYRERSAYDRIPHDCSAYVVHGSDMTYFEHRLSDQKRYLLGTVPDSYEPIEDCDFGEAVHTVGITRVVLNSVLREIKARMDSNSRVWQDMSCQAGSYSSAMRGIVHEQTRLSIEIDRLQSLPTVVPFCMPDFSTDLDFLL